MTTPEALHAALLAVLEAIPGIPAFDGQIPEPLPADAKSGAVYPYTVLWPSPGGAPGEAAVHDTSGALDWSAQITVAAGSPVWCLRAITAVRAAVVGVQLVEDAGPLVDETPTTRPLLKDEDPTPPRWFAPLLFRCLNG